LSPKQQLLDNMDTHPEQLIDARPRPRFEGTVADRGRPSGGHIPHRNVPYAELFDARTGTMKSLDDLRQAFTAARRRTDKADRHNLRLRRIGAGFGHSRSIVSACAQRPLYDGRGPNGACPTGRRRDGPA